MSSSNELSTITSQFETSPEDIPRINVYSTNPNYTTLQLFQEAIDTNAISIILYTTDLCYLSLTRKLAKFKAANGNASFFIPTNPGDVPTPPVRISTRASTAELVIDTSATEETSNPYQAHEAQQVFKDKHQQYNKLRTTTITLRNCIIRYVDDEYIKVHKDKLTRYAKVTLLTLISHLWDTYGEVTIVDLKANEDRMKVQWNLPSPIESLFL